jgi:hypothetical protein
MAWHCFALEMPWDTIHLMIGHIDDRCDINTSLGQQQVSFMTQSCVSCGSFFSSEMQTFFEKSELQMCHGLALQQTEKSDSHFFCN